MVGIVHVFGQRHPRYRELDIIWSVHRAIGCWRNLCSLWWGGLGTIFGLAVLIPSIAVSCRRLHDIDKSGWLQLLVFIPIIGWAFLLYWFVQPGEDGQNSFGANPLGSGA